ncbi:hypothetical protein [Microbispora sp. NPDC049633]|uniref:hypothetical protein n=1 Tax=Microbispora sp. NPDC049633 TaxID=3154355 RepID=UPI00342E89B4
MTVLLKNTFSGGTDGASITSANSGGSSGNAFNLVSSSSAVSYSSTNATGSRAPLVARLTGNPTMAWDLALSGRTAYPRVYVYLPSYPSSNLDVVELDAGINTAAYIRITTTGTVQIVNAATSSAVTGTTTPSAIPTGQWVRIEARFTGATSTTGTCELQVFHNADSATATFTGSGSGQNFRTSAFTVISFRGLSGYTYYLDDVAVSDTGYVGPDQVSVSLTPDTLTGVWALPAPAVSLGTEAAPATLTGSWSLPDPEVTVADGLTAVNPDLLTGVWELPAPTVEAFKNVTVTPDTLAGTWEVFDVVAGVPVNPGDKLTADGQIEWNGFLLGGGTPYSLQQFDGWVNDMPGLDSGNVPQPGRHGSYPGRKLAQERTVTLSGLIRVPRADMAQTVETLIAETPVLEDETELPLAVRILGTVYVGYGSVLRRAVPVDKQYRLGLGRYTLQWVLSDPVLLSQGLNSAVIGDGETQTLTNLGNAASYPLIRVPGPSTNPAVEIQRFGGDARVLEFGLTVPSGQTLVIDTYYGSVKLGGNDVISALSDTSVPVFDLVLAAGQSQVTYDGGGSAPEITVLWRHAYL